MLLKNKDRIVPIAEIISQIWPENNRASEEDVKQYIRHIADRRLLQLGMKPKFGVKDNPLPWLDWVLNGASHDNFFEKRVTEYSVNGMEGDWGWDEVA